MFRRFLSSSATSGKIKVELFYDIVSPFTYLQFELLTRQRPQWHKMDLSFVPVSIASVMKRAENHPPLVNEAKRKYMIKDLKRLAEFHHVCFL